jgi:RNA polymerase sigma-70 factor (ECF subfamily)
MMHAVDDDLDRGFTPLLEQAKAGDDAAWHSLFRLVSGRVMAYLVSRGVRDADDVAADAFADIVRSIHRFEGDRHAFVSWALTIAHRRMVDAFRVAARRQEVATPADDLERMAQIDVEEAVLGLIGAERARRLLGELTPDQADVIALRIYGDLSLPEVAKALGKPLTAVTSLQHRGLEALRRMLTVE